MGFAQAFLGAAGAGDDPAAAVAFHLHVLLQAASPDAPVPPGLPQAGASNLRYGTSLTRHTEDADRRDTLQLSLRRQLQLFEPRIVAIQSLQVDEAPEVNEMRLSLRALLRGGPAGPVGATLDLHSRISLLDHSIGAGQ